jgi:hypothetical protein
MKYLYYLFILFAIFSLLRSCGEGYEMYKQAEAAKPKPAKQENLRPTKNYGPHVINLAPGQASDMFQTYGNRFHMEKSANVWLESFFIDEKTGATFRHPPVMLKMGYDGQLGLNDSKITHVRFVAIDSPADVILTIL